MSGYVILLHGFLRTARSMRGIGRALAQEGYTVFSSTYPSRKKNIEYLANTYLKHIVANCTDTTLPIHFVTHSMGGIIVRYFLATNQLKNLGRVVMLAPPNSGAHLADILYKYPAATTLLGPALHDLQAADQGLAHSLPAPTYEVGIIAGKYDKKVPPESTKLPGMTDFLIVPKFHSFIMCGSNVLEAIKRFLQNGKF